ncbi:hypothetical protein [Streptomyces sp. SID10815]|uniref:hypothetical protein n=1 Tax=Streptomyces sp. SID10815 TaxID=2706027 RepID=UPI0013C790D3|nr:hypothetical protein [Streptomyces sp. SID10815]NEA49969.1 hypothetical protein [Streptomyces sp. SID10815]
MARFDPFDFGVTNVMGLFHQDWIYDGDTAADVVAKYLAQSQDEEVLAVRRDARLLAVLPSATLEVLWEAGSQYMPAFHLVGGGAEWTHTVAGLCEARLSAGAEVHALTGADAEEGAACLDAVVAEIEAVRLLPAEVRSALTECARRCSPDLAFRVLLRAVRCASPEVSLTPAQYARMEAIGSALQYGEFVVDTVEYLVEEA